MDEEHRTGFHEHVFLESHIKEGFPASGPVRNFMELVCIGLSKNPYLSVREKKQHLEWYRNYFADKADIVERALEETRRLEEEEAAIRASADA